MVTTSGWTRGRVLDLHGLPPARVRVARPGVEPPPLARSTPHGRRLLCVAAVIPDKGHDVLLAALARLADLAWSWCASAAGSATRRTPLSWSGLTPAARAATGCASSARAGAELAASYAAADLLVLATRLESYGMVVTEALARGLPVIATAVGGVPEALGHVADGERPGGWCRRTTRTRWPRRTRLAGRRRGCGRLRARALERRTTWRVGRRRPRSSPCSRAAGGVAG